MKKHLITISLMIAFCGSIGQNRTSVRVISKENFTPEVNLILNEALNLVDSVINSVAFRREVMAANFGNANGLTNAQILELLTTGRETHKPIANDTMDLLLKTYDDKKGDNIGTTMHSKVIVTSQAYILKRGSRCYAAHLIHEYCHTIGNGNNGFTHRHSVMWPNIKKKRREKCTSVPYVVGDIARQLLGAGGCNTECQGWMTVTP